jgi:hypothetical protein
MALTCDGFRNLDSTLQCTRHGASSRSLSKIDLRVSSPPPVPGPRGSDSDSDSESDFSLGAGLSRTVPVARPLALAAPVERQGSGAGAASASEAPPTAAVGRYAAGPGALAPCAPTARTATCQWRRFSSGGRWATG